jgi:translocator protein
MGQKEAIEERKGLEVEVLDETTSQEKDVTVIVVPQHSESMSVRPEPLGKGTHAADSRTNCGVSLIQLKFVNLVGFIVVILFNYTSSAGYFSSYGIGTVSRMNPTKISPAGGAFAIWAYIYILQAFFVVYQFVWPKEDEALLLHGVGFWYLGTCLCNSFWIVAFVQGNAAALWCSMFIIFGLLASICKVYMNASCWRRTRPGGVFQFLALDVHFSLYGGWVTVASIVNTSIAINTAWGADPATASACSVIMLVVALVLNTIIAVTRRDCVWPGVLAWASNFISAAHQDDTAVSTCALVVCILIGIVSAGVGVHNIFMLFRGRNATRDENTEGATGGNLPTSTAGLLETRVAVPSETSGK